jgi:hypothetical protein
MKNFKISSAAFALNSLDKSTIFGNIKIVHGNVKDFKCSICDKNFGQRSDLL